MDLLTVFLILFSILSLALGGIVYFKGKNRVSSKFFAFLALFVGLWVAIGIISHYQNISGDSKFGIIWGNISETAASLIFTSFLLFTYSFPSKKMVISRIAFFIILGLQIVLIFLIWAMPGFLTKEIKINPNGYSLEFVNGPVYFYVYMEFILAYFLFGIFNLIKRFREVSGINKVQIKYVLLATGISGSLGIFFGLIVPAINSASDIYYVGRLAAIIFVALNAYAILRYRFLDIKFVIRKGTVFAVTIAIALGLYSYFVFLLSQTTGNIFHIGNDIISIIIIILIAIGFHPLRRMVEYALNAYFFPKRADLRAAANSLNKKLTSTVATIEEMLRTVRDEMRPNLNIEQIDLFIHKAPELWEAVPPISNQAIDIQKGAELISYLSHNFQILIAEELEFRIQEITDEKQKTKLSGIKQFCDQYGIAVFIPLFTGDDLFAILTLGPKTNKDAYSIGDIKFLEEVQLNFSFTLGGAILYHRALSRIQQSMKK